MDNRELPANVAFRGRGIHMVSDRDYRHGELVVTDKYLLFYEQQAIDGVPPILTVEQPLSEITGIDSAIDRGHRKLTISRRGLPLVVQAPDIVGLTNALSTAIKVPPATAADENLDPVVISITGTVPAGFRLDIRLNREDAG